MSKAFISDGAVKYQLRTIKNIIGSTMEMYENTNSIDDIQVNLNAIQKCLDCLRPDESEDE